MGEAALLYFRFSSMQNLDGNFTTISQPQVRFKLASSYSGRVLKHVYEDGQELDSPEEKYPHSFVHHKVPPRHLEVEQLHGFEDSHEQQGGLLLLCGVSVLKAFV